MSDDVTAVPDAEAEREALAWVQEHPWVLTGERITDETAVDHVVAIVRAALARDLPAPTEEPFGVTHLRAAVLTALIDAGHQVRDADVDEIVTRTTRLLGDGWDRLFRAVWSDVSDRAGTAPTDEPDDSTPMGRLRLFVADADRHCVSNNARAWIVGKDLSFLMADLRAIATAPAVDTAAPCGWCGHDPQGAPGCDCACNCSRHYPADRLSWAIDVLDSKITSNERVGAEYIDWDMLPIADARALLRAAQAARSAS